MLWRGPLVTCEFGAHRLPITCSVMSCWLPKVSYGGIIYIKETGKIHKFGPFHLLLERRLLSIYHIALLLGLCTYVFPSTSAWLSLNVSFENFSWLFKIRTDALLYDSLKLGTSLPALWHLSFWFFQYPIWYESWTIKKAECWRIDAF